MLTKLKLTSFAIPASLLFVQTNCKDEPIPPCTDCPTPIDTTSHNWIFEQPQFFGDGASSVFHDVAIINDTLAYAVGEIRFKDSSGNWDPNIYNATKWNGKKWELLQITVRDFGTGTGYYPLYAVYAFGPNDVWFASDADLIQWNGTQFISKAFFMTEIPFNGQVRKMWGAINSNLYCVGNDGAIYHYNGSTWTQILSGTSFNINDIWGDYNNATKQYEVICVASSIGESTDKVILKINGTEIQKLDSSGIGGTLKSIWFKAGKKYYVGGAGIYDKDNLSDITWKSRPNDTLRYYTTQIRGNGINDIVASGNFSEILHFNGNSWAGYYDQTNIGNGGYASIGIKNNLLIAVGSNSPLAAVIVGRRNP